MLRFSDKVTECRFGLRDVLRIHQVSQGVISLPTKSKNIFADS